MAAGLVSPLGSLPCWFWIMDSIEILIIYRTRVTEAHPSALGPGIRPAGPADCIGVQGRVGGRDRGGSSWVRSLSLNGSGSVVGSLPFFSGLGAGRPWAGAGFRIQFRMPVAHSLEHARTGHIFILSIHKVIG